MDRKPLDYPGAIAAIGEDKGRQLGGIEGGNEGAGALAGSDD